MNKFNRLTIFVLTLSLPTASLSNDYEHDLSSHDHWYDIECCSKQDCAPIDPSKEQTITYNPDGSITATSGELIRTFQPDEFKFSRDYENHICVREPMTLPLEHSTTTLPGKILCIYIATTS